MTLGTFTIRHSTYASPIIAQSRLKETLEKTEKSLQSKRKRIRELEAELEKKEGRKTSETDVIRQRLSEELEDEREQHQKDLSERDFTIDQTRKKYQGK